MKNAALKIIVSVFAVVFLVHQIYSSLYKPITTESAVFYEAADGLDITGVIIRQEHPIICNNTGVLHFLAEDGSRVAKNGVVANIYDNASASLTVSRISELENQIRDTQDLLKYNDVQAANLDLINQKVTDALNVLITEGSYGDFGTARDNGNKLLSAFNRRQMVTGEQTDFSAQLTALQSELQSLKASLPAATGSVRADQSGYFVSVNDGYESLLTCDSLDSVTPEFLEELQPGEIPANTIGKIVSDYEWFIAARVTINDSLKYKAGDSLTIKTSLKANPELQVTVKQINISSHSDSAVVIFSCRQMSSELAAMRSGAMTVISKIYSGLRLPKKSLRVVDQVTGVYVVSGISLKFVPVEVIYSNEEYIICKQEQSEEDVLRLYDEVAVKGKKLYDGKIIG